MFLPPQQILELTFFATVADREARVDLAGGYLKDEPDYTSNFTGALRRIINANSQTGLKASSFLLMAGEERATGTDAAIVMLRSGSSKVVLFEAKWPRFTTSGYKWDYIQGSKGKSHFSDQLDRQSRLCSSYAIFEMFYCEYPLNSPSQPQFMETEGASCVWHEDTLNFCKNRSNPDGEWTQSDLKSLLTSNKRSIAYIIGEVARCSKGKLIPMSDPYAINSATEYGLPRQILMISSES